MKILYTGWKENTLRKRRRKVEAEEGTWLIILDEKLYPEGHLKT